VSPTRSGSIFSRLYHGETNVDIVGRWKLWFAVSAMLIAVGIGALATRGLNLGIDFTGGTVWELPAGDAAAADVTAAMADLGYADAQVQELTQAGDGGDERYFRVEAEASASPASETTEALDDLTTSLESLADDVPEAAAAPLETVIETLDAVTGPFAEPIPAELTVFADQVDALAEAPDDVTEADVADLRGQVTVLETLEQSQREELGREVSERLAEITGAEISEVAIDRVGPSWGQQLTEKARTALVWFMLAIMLYITVRFEFRMALATIAALVHDLVLTVGIYSLFGFPVTPATVIALLTILGFSIYDGIVVFDRVDENRSMLGKGAKVTYSEMANLSLNQVLMRSLNTSITAVLPILSILVVGSIVLGESTLQEFGIALFVGVLLGAYSSLFIATPLLAVLKEREPAYRELRERVLANRSGQASPNAVPVVATAGAGGPGAAADAEVAPRPRKQGKKR
jgi:preprotein translocase SecF subunit